MIGSQKPIVQLVQRPHIHFWLFIFGILLILTVREQTGKVDESDREITQPGFELNVSHVHNMSELLLFPAGHVSDLWQQFIFALKSENNVSPGFLEQNLLQFCSTLSAL